MTYLSEMKASWRYLTAAATGMGCGYMLNYYLTGLFAPHLLREFLWTKSEFALLGVGVVLTIFTLPIAGRLTDLLGVRKLALVGIVTSPLIFVAYATMQGSFLYFFVLNLLQLIIVGATTTGVVYSRLIAERFVDARGIALAIAASTPVAIAAAISPVLTGVIDQYGWRTGYLSVAAGSAILGLLVFVLIPADGPKAQDPASRARDYASIIKDARFRLMAAGLFLCNLTLLVQAPQLQLILLERQMDSATAALMLSLYAAGVIGGRLFCGLALDRFPVHIVAALGFGLPAVGLFILGSGAHVEWLLAIGVLIVGIALGAELDITGYMIMRYFAVDIYSTVYSLLAVIINISAACGSLFLSFTLKLTELYDFFLIASGVATLAGSALLALLGFLSKPPASCGNLASVAAEGT